MFSWLSFCILTVSEDLGSFGEQGKGTHMVYLYIWNILSPFPKCNLLDFDALWFYIMAKFEWVSDKITVILCNMSWHVKDEFLRLFVDVDVIPGVWVVRNDDFKLNPVCFACQHKPKTLVLYPISSIHSYLQRKCSRDQAGWGGLQRCDLINGNLTRHPQFRW